MFISPFNGAKTVSFSNGHTLASSYHDSTNYWWRCSTTSKFMIHTQPYQSRSLKRVVVCADFFPEPASSGLAIKSFHHTQKLAAAMPPQVIVCKLQTLSAQVLFLSASSHYPSYAQKMATIAQESSEPLLFYQGTYMTAKAKATKSAKIAAKNAVDGAFRKEKGQATACLNAALHTDIVVFICSHASAMTKTIVVFIGYCGEMFGVLLEIVGVSTRILGLLLKIALCVCELGFSLILNFGMHFYTLTVAYKVLKMVLVAVDKTGTMQRTFVHIDGVIHVITAPVRFMKRKVVSSIVAVPGALYAPVQAMEDAAPVRNLNVTYWDVLGTTVQHGFVD